MPSKLTSPERPPDRDRQGIQLDRLEDEVVRASPYGADRIVERALPGDDDRQDVLVALPDLLAQLQTRHVGHVDIRNHDIDRLGCQPAKALACRMDAVHAQPAPAQAVAQQLRCVNVVINDEDAPVHGKPFSGAE